jgi:hypothetical protein
MIGLAGFIGLVVLAVYGVTQFVLLGSISAGRRPRFRPIPLFTALRGMLGRSIESGRELHVSIGTGSISGEDMAATLAGLQIVEYLADEAAASGVSPVITTADAAALILAEDTLRRPHIRQASLETYQPLSARLPALEPLPYAAATMDYLAHGRVLANVMSGVFGSEAGLMARAAEKDALPQFGGAADPRALAVLLPTTDNLLVGEEMFAAKAYLQARPPHLASLRAQDMARVVMVLGIIGLFIIGLLTSAG